MIHGGSRTAALLFIGDITAFVASLWVTLLIRYQTLPSDSVFVDHLVPFSLLFVIWIFMFYINGLYGKGMILLKSRWPDMLLKIQFTNVVLAALFFFLMPGIGIAPKTNLLIYLIVSLVLIFVWRLVVYPKLTLRANRYGALLIGEGEEVELLRKEVNANSRYHLAFPIVTPYKALMEDEVLFRTLQDSKVEVIVANLNESELGVLLARWYTFFPNVEKSPQILSFSDVYEEVFDRVPLSYVEEYSFLKRSMRSSLFYKVSKRMIDLVGGVVMGIVTLIAIPFIYIANLFEGSGPLFISQHRVGRYGKQIKVWKFRSMRLNKEASGEWTTEEKLQNPITRVGNFLRKTSLDEFPQFVNILGGEISLIGPRSDIEGLAHRLQETIPFYQTRYMVTPGITGWAQINQQYEPGNISPQSIEETKVRLAYDFYYLKKRSLGLDIVIALKTMKRMFFRVSSW